MLFKHGNPLGPMDACISIRPDRVDTWWRVSLLEHFLEPQAGSPFRINPIRIGHGQLALSGANANHAWNCGKDGHAAMQRHVTNDVAKEKPVRPSTKEKLQIGAPFVVKRSIRALSV